MHDPYRRIAKCVVFTVLNAIPQPILLSLARTAAVLPPFLKRLLTARLCGVMSRAISNKYQLIQTNLGIANRIRWHVPLNKQEYVFGRPKDDLIERASIKLTEVLVRDCSHFVDVGAHEGIYTLSTFLAARDIRLHWFEPNAALANRLLINLRENRIPACGNRSAVSESAGCAVFYENSASDDLGSLNPSYSYALGAKRTPVKTISLAEYMNAKNIFNALVKIDVEGAGAQAWKGLESRSDRVMYLIIEMLEAEFQSGLPWHIISKTGWNGYYIRDFELIKINSIDQYDYVPPFWNWLFCHLDASALSQRLSGTKFRVSSMI
jgi:FkbM family methyltransferase